MKRYIETSTTQKVFRWLLAAAMLYAGISHLSINRAHFQAQVPNWLPMDKDLVVILSGLVEIGLALALGFWKKQRVYAGWALGIFFILIFPGNVSQYINGIDAFGVLNSDTARLTRLFFQPVLVAWALWSAGSWTAWKTRNELVVPQ
ncbi:DoxX family protein [Sediminitomix flava]|uniref:Putative membrane protein n=1 Tax=Sediminitomix flava TaxID=379075 RepID=A0A315ZFV4_SEDFL|nr:DoxX family membrane protein [Sediminitomix flava]PWJ44192.1 putative membrane protein [Sediminitomix flava]